MKILHLIPGSHVGMTAPVIAFYDAFFDISVHEFCLHTTNPSEKVLYAEKCRIRQYNFCGDTRRWRDCYRLLKMLAPYDLVVLHNLNSAFSWKTMFLTLTIMRSITPKLVWIEWGGDLYHWCKPVTSHSITHNSLTNWIYRKIYAAFGSRIRNFVAIFPPDKEFFQTVFKSHATVYTAHYICETHQAIFHEFSNYTPMSQKRLANEPIKILVGHRCVQEVDPINTLKVLARFSAENIQVFLPSSGWDPEYIKSVKELAARILGAKATWIDHYMTPDELSSLTKSVDIAIFNTDRNQIALGTIMLLFSEGKKVFISERSAMFDYFKTFNIPIMSYEKIAVGDFRQFTADVDMHNGLEYTMSIRDTPSMARKWQDIYTDILAKLPPRN